MGGRVVRCLFFPDHYWYTSQDLAALRDVLGEVDWVVTTEKDAWKLRSGVDGPERVLVLGVDLRLEQPERLRLRLARFL
jgi:tetraacyldisaccharide-1-P 4'-kinase